MSKKRLARVRPIDDEGTPLSPDNPDDWDGEDYAVLNRARVEEDDDYPDNWDVISKQLRANMGGRCEACGKYLGAKSKDLHVHHVNQWKSDNTAANLMVLCRSCHEKQPGHFRFRDRER